MSLIKRITAALIAISVTAITGCKGITDTGISNETGTAATLVPIAVSEETVEVEGIDKPFDIFFLADSHISLCDDRDGELMVKATDRSLLFKADGIEAWDRFDALIDAANVGDADLVVLGGDIIDSAMYASIDHVKDKLATLNKPYVYLMGNHDFEYGTEYFSGKAYDTYLPRLDELRDGTDYQIREYEDVIVFTADDRNNRIAPEVLEAFKETVQKNKPVVLALHVPIEPVTGSESLIEESREFFGMQDDVIPVFFGEHGCTPDNTTREFIDMVLSDESPVALVLAGHIHFYHKEMLNERTLQIITGAAFTGEAVNIKLIPKD